MRQRARRCYCLRWRKQLPQQRVQVRREQSTVSKQRQLVLAPAQVLALGLLLALVLALALLLALALALLLAQLLLPQARLLALPLPLALLLAMVLALLLPQLLLPLPLLPRLLALPLPLALLLAMVLPVELLGLVHRRHTGGGGIGRGGRAMQGGEGYAINC
jgi:hypothetical protein